MQKIYKVSLTDESINVGFYFSDIKNFTGSVRVGNFLFDTSVTYDLNVTSNIGSSMKETI